MAYPVVLDAFEYPNVHFFVYADEQHVLCQASHDQD